ALRLPDLGADRRRLLLRVVVARGDLEDAGEVLEGLVLLPALQGRVAGVELALGLGELLGEGLLLRISGRKERRELAERRARLPELPEGDLLVEPRAERPDGPDALVRAVDLGPDDGRLLEARRQRLEGLDRLVPAL